MLPERVPSDPEPKKEKDERRKIIIALLFLLLSFSCIFCSSQSALWLIDRDRIEASMLSNKSADYGSGPAIALAPLAGDIAAEANRDEELLLLKQTPIAGGLGVVILPNPIPTPQPTLVAILPTPTLTPTVSAPGPVAPTSMPVGSSPTTSAPTPVAPTAPPPTSTPSTALPPTSTPSTALPPTSTPSTAPPPTSTPSTAPPPTSTPTSPPPTSTSTSPPPTATATATATPTNTPTPPVVQFSALAYTASEADGMTLITVTLSGASTLTVTVNYATSNGTATAGSDYAGTSGVLAFPPGVTSQAFPVTILNDTLDELDETVFLALSAPTNATLGSPNSATLTIVDDDVSPTVQFSSPTYGVGEAGGTTSVTVNLSTASGLTVTVNYAASDGTATAGSDYTATNGALTFAPGVTSQTFQVTILDDVFDEADETVALALSAPINAALGVPSSATLTIVDDDASPTVQFSAATYSVSEGPGPVTMTPITVTLSAASGLTVTVDYASSDLTATAGSDYLAATGTLTFAPGITSQTFPITIMNDTLDEPNKIVRLTLANPVNATLGVTSTATLTIIDDDTPGSCSGAYPNGEPNIGPPDANPPAGQFARIGCGAEMKIDLGTPINMGDPGNPDLVYYEMQGQPPPPPPYYIYMDLIQVQIGQTPSGPWFTVFEWGDGILDTNTNIGGTYADGGPPSDNTTMISPPLVGLGDPLNTGIQIDVDSSPAAVPPGTYQYIRLYSPLGGGSSGPEIDAIEVLP